MKNEAAIFFPFQNIKKFSCSNYEKFHFSKVHKNETAQKQIFYQTHVKFQTYLQMKCFAFQMRILHILIRKFFATLTFVRWKKPLNVM